MMKYKILILFILIVGLQQAHAQWECPSKLAAHLDPAFNSPLLIGAETELSTGMLDGNSISTAMAFVGIDYTTQKHSLYFEGGFKAWWKYDFDEELLFDQYRFGFREMFYQYRGQLSNFTLGLQTSTFDDFYLLNERIAGANYKLDLGLWKFNAYGGTVTKDFARNGIFCTTGFIYDLPTGQQQVVLGNNLGDKNFGGFTFTFFPGKDKKAKTQVPQTNEDEFESFEEDEFETVDKEFESSDEFEAFDSDDFGELETTNSKGTSTKSGSSFGIEKFGLAGYSEFGDWIDNTFYHAGLFVSIKLPGEIYLKPEALIQIEEFNKGLIYMAILEKDFSLNNGHRLTLNASYYGFSEIDDGAMVLNSYSNILAGEVLRLDAVNMPFYLLSAKFTIPSAKFHVKLQNAGQLGSGDLNEWDIELGKKFFDKLHVNIKGGIIEGGELDNKAYLARLGARYYF